MRTPNILIVTNLYPNPVDMQRGLYVEQLVKNLNNDYNITLLSPLPWFPRVKLFSIFKKWYDFARIPYRAVINEQVVYYPKYIVIPKIFEGMHAYSLYLSIHRMVKRLHKKKKFNLIHGKWMFPDGVVAAKLSKELNIPCVLSAHGCDINRDTKNKNKAPQIINSLQTCDKVIAVSNPLGEVIKKLGVTEYKVSVIPNGVDLALFQIMDKKKAKEKLELDPQRKMILFVGELAEVKGIEYLLQAIKRIKENGASDFDVNIIGAGALAWELKIKTEALKITDTVYFRGVKKHKEVRTWISACDLLCLPSIREGTPNVILESFASGRPVVASNVGGIPYMVTDRNAILFPSGDDKALSIALIKALETEWNPEEIRSSVADRSWKSVAKKYASAFNETVN